MGKKYLILRVSFQVFRIILCNIIYKLLEASSSKAAENRCLVMRVRDNRDEMQ